jgi:hypothetical protein
MRNDFDSLKVFFILAVWLNCKYQLKWIENCKLQLEWKLDCSLKTNSHFAIMFACPRARDQMNDEERIGQKQKCFSKYHQIKFSKKRKGLMNCNFYCGILYFLLPTNTYLHSENLNWIYLVVDVKTACELPTANSKLICKKFHLV